MTKKSDKNTKNTNKSDKKSSIFHNIIIPGGIRVLFPK